MMIEIKHAERDRWKEDREPLFTLEDKDGEITEYTIPREVPGHFTLAALERNRHQGEAVTTPWVLEEMLGSAGYAALLNAPGLTKANLAAVNEVIRRKVFGDPEDTTSEPGKR